AGPEHPGDDLELVGQDGQPLPRGREAVAVGQPLVLLPAGPDPEDRPATADHVDRGDRLRGEPGVAVGRAEHQVSELRSLRFDRERGKLGEGLEDDRLLRGRVDLHVVVDPERVETQVFAEPRDLDGSAPGGDRVDTEVLAVAALRQAEAQLHRPTSVAVPAPAGSPGQAPNARSTSSWTRATCSSVTVTTSATENHRSTSRTYRPSVRRASSTSSQVTPIASGRMSTPARAI